VAATLELVGLSDRATEPVSKYSGGMQRRLNFACGIIHEPAVLLLDEPTVGVDPQSRVRLLELVRRVADEGACVLYTTHYMEEAEDLCDRLGVIDHGKLIALGTLAELQSQVGERDLLRLAGRFEPAGMRAALERLDGAEIVAVETGTLTVALADGTRKLPDVLAALTAAGAEVRETTLNRPSLESLFIKLTGRELRE
jgi:ABC-2 type transport system ATP-binding protein